MAKFGPANFQPISNQTLTFNPTIPGPISGATTDASGMYSLQLAAGTYSVRLISQSSFQPIAVSGSSFFLPPGATDPEVVLLGQKDFRADFVFDMCPPCQ